MNLLAVLIVISAIFQFVLVYLVYKKNPNSHINRAFAVFGFLLAIWSILLLMYSFPVIGDVNIWIKFVYSVGTLMALGAIYFAHYFPSETTNIPKVLNYFHVASVLTFLYLILFTDLFVKEAGIRPEGSYTKTGIAYYFYGIWATVVTIQIIIEIYQKGKLLKGKRKSQLKFMIIGLTVLALWVLIPDIVLPVVFDYPYLFGLSAIGPGIFSAIVAYSILKYRFLGLNVILGRILYSTLIGIVGFVLFNAIAFFHIRLWGDVFSPGALITGFLLTFAAVPIFLNSSKILKKFAEKLLIHVKYDPYEVINNLLKVTSTELEIENVVDAVIKIIQDTFKIEETGVLVFGSEKAEKFVFKKLVSFKEIESEYLDHVAKVVDFWTLQEHSGKKSEVLVYDELLSRAELSKKEAQILVEILNLMRANDISVILPLNRKVQLNGLILIGNKKNDEAFTIEDINLLESIIANASVAVGRALLYEQVEEAAETLQLKVDEATQDLKNKMEALREARRKERDMVDILGHELRTPMSIIKSGFGFVRMLFDSKVNAKVDAETKEQLERYGNSIDENIEREIRLIDTLLGATKIDKHQVNLLREEVDILDVIEDGITGQKKFAKLKDIYLRFEKPPNWQTFPKVFADRARIQEIMDNLLSNAVKYTEIGGVIVEVDYDKEFVAVHVHDTGVGIPKKAQKGLGKKFFRVNQYTDDKKGKYDVLEIVRPGGTGLGLFVTYGLVKVHGGKIWVESDAGQGSVFHFTIPIYNGQKVTKMKKVDDQKEVFQRLGLKRNEKE
jgi:signal transduction histidine kinase